MLECKYNSTYNNMQSAEGIIINIYDWNQRFVTSCQSGEQIKLQ